MAFKLNPFTNELDFYDSSNLVVTDPPATMYRVTNLYVDPAGGLTLVIKYEDSDSVGAGSIVSDPPTGKYRVTKVHVNPDNGRLVVSYDDTPTPA
jgi:hypothetical protein